MDIFGDGSVVALHLPGHTPDHLALLVKLASGPVLLSGDLYHSREAREKRGVPPFNTSRDQTLQSMDKFEKLAKDTGAKVDHPARAARHRPASGIPEGGEVSARAVSATSRAGPTRSGWRSCRIRKPGPGELLVRVRAAAINFPDVLIIEDKYQLKPPRPFAPGGEIAGEVEAVGEGVEGWSVGDRVIAVTGFGGLAEKIVDPRQVRLPAAG